jgi:hypothetical protein
MRHIVLAGLLTLALAGCDVFLDDWGGLAKACLSNDDCQDGLFCYDAEICVPYETYCEKDEHCAWIGAEAYCPPGLYDCEDGFGESCEDSSECDTGDYTECKLFYATADSEESFCTMHCQTNSECDLRLDDRRCTASPEGYLVCALPGWSPKQGNVCTDNSDCEPDAQCIQLDRLDATICMRDCNPDANICDSDQMCEIPEHGSDEFCFFPQWRGFSDWCETDDDCVDSLFGTCVDSGTDSWCTRDCSTNPCPPYSSCASVAGQLVCDPD